MLFFKYLTRLFTGSPPLLPKPTTTTTQSSPPWSQTSNPTLATTLFSHGSGMPLSLSLSLSLWVALLMVLKSKTVWHFVYTEGSERWRIRCLRKYWTRSCHSFCRNARRPSIPIDVTKTTYGTSAFGYSWYFTNPSLFLFFVFFLMILILGRWVS